MEAQNMLVKRKKKVKKSLPAENKPNLKLFTEEALVQAAVDAGFLAARRPFADQRGHGGDAHRVTKLPRNRASG